MVKWLWVILICYAVVVGCDGVLDSGLVHDECGVCGGDNSSCTGMFRCSVVCDESVVCCFCLKSVCLYRALFTVLV